ncbi:MAG: GTPase [Woeseiaceae bacterium]|nr:GTPase [Woeseiaceae bacterium]
MAARRCASFRWIRFSGSLCAHETRPLHPREHRRADRAVLFVIAIGALLFVTESALNVWDRLLEGPALLRYGYVAGMAALLVAAAWLVVRLLVRRKPAKRKEQASRPLTRDEIEARLRAADEAGVETGAADEELRMLAERQQTGSVHLCFFGEISTGKSSLLKALVPAADVAISAVGGSTLDIRHFRWQNDNGVEVLLTDYPVLLASHRA